MKTTIDEDIKSGEFKRAYLLCGEERFLVKSYQRRLHEAVCGEQESSANKFSGRGIDLKELISLAETMPFFSTYRLIEVEDSGFFKKASAELADWIETCPDTTVLLFVESEVDKRQSLYKKVSKIGCVQEFERQDESSLIRWCVGYANSCKKKMSSSTAAMILRRAGSDMAELKTEMDKLVGYAGEEEQITAEAVEQIVTINAESRVFSLVDDIAEGKLPAAIREYQALMANREPALKILALIGRQFSRLLAVQDMAARHMDARSIQGALKVSRGAVQQMQRQAARFTGTQLQEAVSRVAEAEEDVKTGKMDEKLAVELVIMGRYR